MKTVKVNGKRLKTTYKTSSDMRTKAEYRGRTYRHGLGCDVYNVEDDEHIALILTTRNGDLSNSATVITQKEYSEIADLYDPYHSGRYHTALLERCGAENHLKLN